MTAALIDGVAVARERAETLKQRLAPNVTLGIILATDNAATKRYVAAKQKVADTLGVSLRVESLGATATKAEIIAACSRFNKDTGITAYIVQLPLPDSVEPRAIFAAVDPAKDADGLTATHLGKMVAGSSTVLPATARGVLSLLDHYGVPLTGATVTVIGRGMLAGLPCAIALGHRGATVTSCDTHTQDLVAATRGADIVVSAAGHPGLLTARMVKPGAVVIDIGTTQVGDALVGDVVFDDVRKVAGLISPVPGGVGPLTVISLFENLHDLAA
jgi:methylenetetrahydrofolate dehydrogenase (NADP+)/methenyltetrahydrofolate cyclohydrolase